jgi:Tfp pilus assembly PilM family ATPase
VTLRKKLHNILFQPTYAAGLEIEDDVIRVAHAEPGTQKITTVHEHTIPGGIVINGEITNERDFAAELAEALRASSVRNTYYVTHSPPRQTALRLLQFPAMPAKELRDAVRFEAARSLPYTLAEAAISFCRAEDVITTKETTKKTPKATPKLSLPTLRKKPPEVTNDAGTDSGSEPEKPPEPVKKKGPQPSELLVAATPNAQILMLMRVAKTAGIKLGVVEPKQLATLRTLQHHKAIQTNDLILDIQTNYSVINVIINGAVKLNRILNYTRENLKNPLDADTLDAFLNDISMTMDYLTRIDDTIILNRILIVGGELREDYVELLESIALQVNHFTNPNDTPPQTNTVIGHALRGARGI